jgi:poly(A) polymerase
VDDRSRQGLDQMIDDLMLPGLRALGIARRDRELARQILMAHRRMVEAVTRK